MALQKITNSSEIPGGDIQILNPLARLVQTYAGGLSQGDGYSKEVYATLNNFLDIFHDISGEGRRNIYVENFLQTHKKPEGIKDQLYQLAQECGNKRFNPKNS